MQFERVAVGGGGIMGSGIAEVCARAGADVIVHELDNVQATATRDHIHASLDRAVRSGKLAAADAGLARGRLGVTSDISALHDRQLVVEAIVEDEQAKLKVFAEVDSILTDPDAILASNTSSIPIMKLAMATGRRDRVIGLHFFNPVPVLGLVEVIPSLLTSEATVGHVADFVANHLGKHAIRSQDRAGFIVNALLIPYILSAIRMLESGSPLPRTSTRAWSAAPPTPWAHWPSPTSSASTPPMRWRSPCTRSSRNRCSRPPTAVPNGRCRTARPQDRPRLPHVRVTSPAHRPGHAGRPHRAHSDNL